MIVLGSIAFTQGLKHYEAIAKRGINFWENTRIFLLQRSVSSIFDYFVHDSTGRFFPFFLGEIDFVSYVTSCAMSYDLPVLVILSKEKRDDGYFDLNYYELPVLTMNYEEIEKLINLREYRKTAHRVLLLSNLEDLSFSYYVFDQKRGFYVWVSSLDGRSHLRLPKMIKIEYKEKNGPREILFLGLQVDSTRKLIYNELYQ